MCFSATASFSADTTLLSTGVSLLLSSHQMVQIFCRAGNFPHGVCSSLMGRKRGLPLPKKLPESTLSDCWEILS